MKHEIMNNSHHRLWHLATTTLLLLFGVIAVAEAQSILYPSHFNLHEVELSAGSPFKKAMDINIRTLLSYDADRLLTPYIKEAGIDEEWQKKHPSFPNWGSGGFNLDGHVGGHYLTALSLAMAACHDKNIAAQLNERIEYIVDYLDKCQRVFDNDTTGMRGFIGGQPLKKVWQALYKGDIQPFINVRGQVPFYCEHKILAGLRDAYVYAENKKALRIFLKMSHWAADIIKEVSDNDMQELLNVEYGGMNEVLADAYHLSGDINFLLAAKKYSQKAMIEGMQELNPHFLDGYHANTQIPKYIGFERIYQLTKNHLDDNYPRAVKNFWNDIAYNRTVCIGGNSIHEHFLNSEHPERYITELDGPESCNSNNMLKLTEMLADGDGNRQQLTDFYEKVMLNHILSTQDPETGGYVYFTTLRPLGYRIYSQVNKAMWCCVGTGMENHSKYAQYIYTHKGDDTLFVNLFIASRLRNKKFEITQQTDFPYGWKSKLTTGKSGTYTVAVRKPSWSDNYAIRVNGKLIFQGNNSNNDAELIDGYAHICRHWKSGDVIQVDYPTSLRFETCPGLDDYIAFFYGPVLLGGVAGGDDLKNEYAGEGRMDHAPGNMAVARRLTEAPMLIGERKDVISNVQTVNADSLLFAIDNATNTSGTILLKPFFSIHHRRYMCYWYQATANKYAHSDLAKQEEEAARLAAQTLDFVSPGEQQSEAGHDYAYSANSFASTYGGERFRGAKAGGYVQYTLCDTQKTDNCILRLKMIKDKRRNQTFQLVVNGKRMPEMTIDKGRGFCEKDIFLNKADDGRYTIKIEAAENLPLPNIFSIRLLKKSK